MPIDPGDFRTGGALQSAVAASLVRARHAPAELTPGFQVGNYRVLSELGRGGMAIVYLAERADGEYEQQVALKWMLQARPDALNEALFRRERQALADLRHPHVARLMDGGRTDDGRPWFAMERITGERLDRHCVQAGLSTRQRLSLFLQVCAAVAFAHARGMIHRDIKPSNVLVDSDGSAKLLDFGIAQLVGQDDALAARAYTPGFASPEQVRGEALTVQSDVYQLGRLLASLLSADAVEQATMAGTVVIEAPGRTASGAEGVDAAPSLPAGLNADLAAILRKATAADPPNRYATADNLADDVRAWLEHRPVAAQPRRAAYLAARLVQRHPFSTALGALGVLTLIATVAAFTWRLAQERDRALAEARRAEAGEEFLVSLFRVSDPGVNRGAKLTARELLDRGAARIESDTRMPSSLRARLMHVLTQVDFNLGEFDRAQRLLDRALAEEGLGPQRFPLLAQQLWLLQRRGETARAVEAAPATLAEIPETPEFDRVRADALNAAGRAAAQTGDPRAQAWLEQAMHAANRSGDAEQQGKAYRALGFLQENAGDTRRALESTTLAAQRLALALGDSAPDVLSARVNRAYLLGETRQQEAALQEIEAVHRIAEPLLPSAHMLRIYIDVGRAWAYRDAGRAEQALSIGRSAAERCVATMGESHMQCGSALFATANALGDLGRRDEAVAWFERLVASRRAGMGAEHVYTAHAEHRLAEAYCKAGRHAEGRPIAARISARFTRELPEDNADRKSARQTLALCEAQPP